MNNDEFLKLPDFSRRGFVGAALTAGTLLAQSEEDEHDHKESERHRRRRRHKKERRNLFLNLSHQSYSGREYYLVLGKHRHRLRELPSGDPVLAKHRQHNQLLAQIPDSQITHVIENVELSTDQVHLSYLVSEPDTTTGKWFMSAVFVSPPTTALHYAYNRARDMSNDGNSLRLSAKRRKYGLQSATSLQDLLDESALLDTTDWAAALVNLHPEMLSADPESAAHIQTNYIQTGSNTFELSQVLSLAGPAAPQGDVPSASGGTPWATLVPFTDTDGSPLVNTKGNNKGLILYDAQWDPNLSQAFIAPAMNPALQSVKNDSTLGADVTSGGQSVTNGCLWTRNDGGTSINVPPHPGLASGNSSYTLSNITKGYNGYSCSASVSVDGDAAQITLGFKNWFVRYLALYIQFFNENNSVPASQLPSGTLPNISSVTPNNEILLGSLTPEFTLYGIPVAASSNSVVVNFPTSVATSAKILASGLGTGTHTASDTEIYGIVMTSLFNLAIPAALLALTIGTEIDVFVRTLAFPFALLVAQEVATAAENGSSSQIITIFWRSVVKGALGPSLKAFVTGFLNFLIAAEVIDGLEDAIPIAGEIIQALGVIGTLAEIAETTVETSASPWTYEYDLVGTYDLSLGLVHATNDTSFPATAATYKVTANFDNGTPQVQTLTMPGGRVSTLPAVVFPGVPLGGNVTLSVGFYASDNTLVGQGTTGSILNVPSTAPSITITELQYPITATTVYHHQQKTGLDAAGNHLWLCSPAPALPSNPVACDPAPGNICNYRDITFSPAFGDVGYAWQSYSTSPCGSSGSGNGGQLDQMASISNVNSGANAQQDYASLPHSLIGTGKLIYDPSGKSKNNYYIDTTNSANIVRQVTLGPTVFPDPCASQQAWGQFTMSPDDILLHPSGAIVSINTTLNRMECLKLPATYSSDNNAQLATLHGGLGSRPGLFNSPTVATITPDGVILIIESGNNRVHSVDAFGNPVRHFPNQPEPYFLTFTTTGGSTTQYLDVAAEFSGLIYVLSITNSVYRLDIYDPKSAGSSPLSTTLGLNAAKVTVDYWRTVYSLNYEVLTIDGNLPPSGVTEPSVSQWIPTTPNACSLRTPPPALTSEQRLVSPPNTLSRRSWLSASLPVGARRHS